MTRIERHFFYLAIFNFFLYFLNNLLLISAHMFSSPNIYKYQIFRTYNCIYFKNIYLLRFEIAVQFLM